LPMSAGIRVAQGQFPGKGGVSSSGSDMALPAAKLLLTGNA
jgi:hypothetical protein